jgi:hypothetical protein
MRNKPRRRPAGLAASLVAALLAAGSAVAVPDATANRHAAIRVTGSLDLRSTLNATSLGVDCPSGAPSDASCRARADKGLIRGLGSVTATYVWYFTTSGGNCPSDLVRPFATTAQIVVAGKGEIRLAISPGEHCVDVEPVRNEPQAFTITGGSGAYDGATGSGLLERNLANGLGTETLTGALTVPGLEFDLEPPTFTGVSGKTVRAAKGAKSARVAYTVAAMDAADGVLRPRCLPVSGSRFPLGRTTVTCEATDKSANTASVKFLVTVRKAP